MESDQSRVRTQARRVCGISKERESFLPRAGSRDTAGDGASELGLECWEGFYQINRIARTRLLSSEWVVSEGRGQIRVWAEELMSSMPHSRDGALV